MRALSQAHPTYPGIEMTYGLGQIHLWRYEHALAPLAT